MGLVDLYIQKGVPVGSQTLKESGLEDISSATIRNYFSKLEQEGYLSQQHSSGGRIPTNKAYALYAKEHLHAEHLDDNIILALQELKQQETKEIASYLQLAAETLSHITGLAAFMSAPRFDHDFIQDIKLVRIDRRRTLCVILSEFGQIQTEVLHSDQKISTFALHRMEAYFHYRLTGYSKPENMEPEEELLAQRFYNEIMVRYIVEYSNFTHEHVYQTGFSKLLQFPESTEAAALTSSLSLFENTNGVRLLLRESAKHKNPQFWIGKDLNTYCNSPEELAVVAAPYYIHQSPVGAIGLLGPSRMPYKTLFPALRLAADCISQTLTKSLYKFKLRYRKAERAHPEIESPGPQLKEQVSPILLEDKRNLDGK